ncbi:MAG: stage II sporulation protein M [archaeon]
MVLESLLNPFAVKKKPWEMFLAGFIYSLIGLFISYIVLRDYAGLLLVFLTVMAAMPLIYKTMINEEELGMKLNSRWRILREHSHVLTFLMLFFLGVVTSLSLAYIFLPVTMVESIFKIQSWAILNVNTAVSGSLTQFGLFKGIFMNNLRVLFICLIFSFMYGLGAIFILTWNASVVSAAIGNLIKTKIASVGAVFGFDVITTYFGIATLSVMRYMFHGLMEIAAYFVAGLAGGIISVAVIKHNLNNEKVIRDALDLFFISLAILIIAAVVEVYVTPHLFYSYI